MNEYRVGVRKSFRDRAIPVGEDSGATMRDVKRLPDDAAEFPARSTLQGAKPMEE